MLNLLTQTQVGEVKNLTAAMVAQAADRYHRKIPAIEVLFNLKGAAAGQFRVHSGNCQIRYNPQIFNLYFKENIATTIPHEVAHYLVYRLYPKGRTGRWKVKPHGQEWLGIMADFGANPSVCHNFDLADISRRQERRFEYSCACRHHQISCRRHNKIQKLQMRYLCKYCQSELRLTP